MLICFNFIIYMCRDANPKQRQRSVSRKMGRGIRCWLQSKLLGVVRVFPPLFQDFFWKQRSQILYSDVFKFDFKKSFSIAFVCYTQFHVKASLHILHHYLCGKAAFNSCINFRNISALVCNVKNSQCNFNLLIDIISLIYSATCAIWHLSFPTSCDIWQKLMVLK